MTHVAVLGKAADKDPLLKWLYSARAFHVMPIEEGAEEWTSRFANLPDDSTKADAVLARINSVVSFCQEFRARKPDFIDSMLPIKVVGTKSEIDAAIREADVDRLYGETGELRSKMEERQDALNRLNTHQDAVRQFAFLGDDLPKLENLGNVEFVVVAVSGQGGKAFLLDSRVGDMIMAGELTSDQTQSYYALVTPKSNAGGIKELIDDHGLHVYPLPKVDRGAAAELAAVGREIADVQAALDALRGESAAFADRWIKKAGLAAGHWESEKNLKVAQTRMTESGNLFVTRGYVKTERLAEVSTDLEKAVPGASMLPAEAPEGEDPPISLKWNKWLRPASLLVKMYGLPAYAGVDPTVFVATIFFLFVGICLGDAAYGLLLILLMLWLKRRYRDQSGLQDFFQVFVYCGIVTMIMGVLTGSFFGDVSSIIPGMEGFDKVRTSLAVIDPIKDSQLALYIAVGIGVATQFYGMGVRTYLNWRRGDRMGAFSDGILWMCFFGFIIAAGATGLIHFWVLAILSGFGLILTQGRDQPNWLLRIVVGVISLYGIVGAYGASAFLGDVISYARLMALALTGAALGSTFNMLAQLGGQIAFVGGIIAVVILVLGHLMNFFLSALGAFVHSARLVMLEFFGRFYESGGYAYKPYGFDSETVDIKFE
jgi:V/A-type H+-transporting ATPase subunit I